MNCSRKLPRRNLELLKGTEYNVVIRQAWIVREDGPAWRADFVLQPYDELSFKPPEMGIERSEDLGHARFFAHPHEALGQVRGYADSFDNDQVRDRFKIRYELGGYRPRAQLIVVVRDPEVTPDVRVLTECSKNLLLSHLTRY